MHRQRLHHIFRLNIESIEENFYSYTRKLVKISFICVETEQKGCCSCSPNSLLQLPLCSNRQKKITTHYSLFETIFHFKFPLLALSFFTMQLPCSLLRVITEREGNVNRKAKYHETGNFFRLQSS